jgi:hypothetical protein
MRARLSQERFDLQKINEAVIDTGRNEAIIRAPMNHVFNQIFPGPRFALRACTWNRAAACDASPRGLDQLMR